MCGVHQCDPAECFDIHYPKAHRMIHEQVSDERCTELIEKTFKEVMRKLKDPLFDFEAASALDHPKMQTFVKMVIAASIGPIERETMEIFKNLLLGGESGLLRET